MTFKLLSSAAIALSLMAGAAVAQTASGDSTSTQTMQSGPNSTPNYASDEEKMMFDENREMLGGFFTDDTMGTMRSEAEMKAAYDALDADSQTELKAKCDAAMQNRGQYGNSTTAICQQAGVM